MTGTDEHDLSGVAIGGGVAGWFTAVVRAIQTPTTPKDVGRESLMGLCLSAIGAVTVKVVYPNTPVEVAIMAGAGIGLFTKEIAKMSINIVGRLFARVSDTLDRKLDDAGWRSSPDVSARPAEKPADKPGVGADGSNAAAHPAAGTDRR